MFLFCIVLDPIIVKLREKYPTIAYADDIIVGVKDSNDIKNVLTDL